MDPSPLEPFIESARAQVAAGELLMALDRVQNYLSAASPSLRDEAILLASRYHRVHREERKGQLTYEQAHVERNRITDAILDLLQELPYRLSPDVLPVAVPASEIEEHAVPEQAGLEVILGVNNLKQISWIEQAAQVARSVCRILTPSGLGTGFLVAPDLVMTNHHVLPTADVAADSVIEFDFQQGAAGNLLPTYRYWLDPARFHARKRLDYALVGVLPDPNRPSLERWGFLELNPNADPVPGEHVVIIQHPNGGLKQIVLTANQVVNLWEHRLQYTTDTMPGSSGSPVLNDSWHVIAIHHAGGDLRVNEQGVRRFVNEGILMSAIRSDAGKWWPEQKPAARA